MYYPCKDPLRCGVKRHKASTVNPACGATANANKKSSVASLVSAAPISTAARVPSRQSGTDFSVSRASTRGGGVVWGFPVSFRGVKRSASVTRERSHSILNVRMSDPAGYFEASLVPLDTRGATPGGFLVSMDAGDGRHAVVYTVRPKESPVEAETSVERLDRLHKDSNWEVSEGGPTLKHIGTRAVEGSEEDSVVLPATEDRALAAAKAARLCGTLSAVHSSTRSRAMTSYDEQGLGKMSSANGDREMEDALAKSGLSLNAQMV